MQLHREKKKVKIPVPWKKNNPKKLPSSPGRVFQFHWWHLRGVCFGLLLENVKDLGKLPWHRYPQSSITPQTSTFPSLCPLGWNPGTQTSRFFRVLRFYGVRKSLVSFQQHNKGILWINIGKLPALLNHLLIGSTCWESRRGNRRDGRAPK